MNRELILVAASGLSREVIEAVNAVGRYHVLAIVDDDPTRWGEVLGGVTVLGGLEELAAYPDTDVVVCAGKGSVRQQLVNRLRGEGYPDTRFATVVHPSVQLPASGGVGPGSILLAGCVITADVEVGRHVVAMPNVTLTHDVVIEDFATLCAAVTLGGAVHVGQRSYIGMAASVRENCQVGADSMIGMGAVVVTDVPAGELWFGVPARHCATQSSRDERLLV